MSKKRRDAFALLAVTLAALGVILWGACFCIAPVWQWRYRPVEYQPPVQTVQHEADTVNWPIDINRAGAEQLMQLPGIGESKAAAILAYRNENGAFATVEELEQVRGISARMVKEWAGMIEANPVY